MVDSVRSELLSSEKKIVKSLWSREGANIYIAGRHRVRSFMSCAVVVVVVVVLEDVMQTESVLMMTMPMVTSAGKKKQPSMYVTIQLMTGQPASSRSVAAASDRRVHAGTRAGVCPSGHCHGSSCMRSR